MMGNPFFGAMGGGKPNLMQMIQQIKANPAQFLLQSKFNVPQGMSDPNAIVQHLLSSGQISQDQINRAYSMARQIGMK